MLSGDQAGGLWVVSGLPRFVHVGWASTRYSELTALELATSPVVIDMAGIVHREGGTLSPLGIVMPLYSRSSMTCEPPRRHLSHNSPAVTSPIAASRPPLQNLLATAPGSTDPARAAHTPSPAPRDREEPAARGQRGGGRGARLAHHEDERRLEAERLGDVGAEERHALGERERRVQSRERRVSLREGTARFTTIKGGDGAIHDNGRKRVQVEQEDAWQGTEAP